MRLIDADKMLKRIESWNTSDAMDKALYNFTLNRIIEQPTVEAIPIEWIKKYTEENRLYQSDDFDLYISDMIADWAERKDEYVTLHHEDIHFNSEEDEKAFYEALAEMKNTRSFTAEEWEFYKKVNREKMHKTGLNIRDFMGEERKEE